MWSSQRTLLFPLLMLTYPWYHGVFPWLPCILGREKNNGEQLCERGFSPPVVPTSLCYMCGPGTKCVSPSETRARWAIYARDSWYPVTTALKMTMPWKKSINNCTYKFLCLFFKGKILQWISSEVIWDLFKHLALIRKQENMSKLDPIWTGFVYPSHLEFNPQILVLTSS